MVVTIIAFCLFLFEIVFQSLLHRRYFGRFYFLLDLAGTLALVPDILTLLNSTVDQISYVDVISLARAGRVARSAG